MDPQEELDDLQRKAAKIYEAVRQEHKRLNLPFGGDVSENGSPPAVSPGVTLLPSLTEMADLGQLITLALSYWTQYRELPTVGQLHSSAESSEVDQVVFITTLYCTAMLGAFLAQIGSGDLDTVSSMLTLMTQVREGPTTSHDTSSRMPRRIAGLSTPDKDAQDLPYPPPGHMTEDEQPAGTNTNNGGSRKKKKSHKSRRGKKKRQKTTN